MKFQTNNIADIILTDDEISILNQVETILEEIKICILNHEDCDIYVIKKMKLFMTQFMRALTLSKII